jgi:hypothetical protein
MLTTDLEAIQLIHNRHFNGEFELPDFSKFLGLFVVENDSHIIVAGGVRPIAESILITDKDFNASDRVRALHKALDISEYMTRAVGFDSLHAFVTEENWYRQLQGKGFVQTKGQSLILPL